MMFIVAGCIVEPSKIEQKKKVRICRKNGRLGLGERNLDNCDFESLSDNNDFVFCPFCGSQAYQEMAVIDIVTDVDGHNKLKVPNNDPVLMFNVNGSYVIGIVLVQNDEFASVTNSLLDDTNDKKDTVKKSLSTYQIYDENTYGCYVIRVN